MKSTRTNVQSKLMDNMTEYAVKSKIRNHFVTWSNLGLNIQLEKHRKIRGKLRIPLI